MRRVAILVLGAIATVGTLCVVALPASASSSVTLGSATCSLNGPDVTLNGTWSAGTSTCTVQGFAAVQAGSTLTIPSGTTLTDTAPSNAFDNGGTVVDDGTVGACLWSDFGAGITTNAAGGTFSVSKLGSCHSAEHEIYVGGTFQNHGSYANSGSLVIDGNKGGASFTNYCGSTYSETGSVVVVNGGKLVPASGCPQTISFTGPGTGFVGGSYTPSATASSGLAVSFALDASSTGCTLEPGSVQFSGAGTCVVDATQAGDGTYAAATPVQVSTVISLNAQTISFTGPGTGFVGGSYTPSATASSGLAVSFALDASSTGCTLEPGSVQFSGAGTCVVDATQAGDGTYAAATPVQVSTVISLNAQSISFTGPGTGFVGGSYTPSATASSGLAVSFALDASSTGCTLEPGSVQFSGAGTCVVDATQAGDGTYAAATPVQVSTVISLNAQSISFTGPGTGFVGGPTRRRPPPPRGWR